MRIWLHSVHGCGEMLAIFLSMRGLPVLLASFDSVIAARATALATTIAMGLNMKQRVMLWSQLDLHQAPDAIAELDGLVDHVLALKVALGHSEGLNG